MTGTAVVEELLKNNQYSKIYTLSRSQKGESHEKIQHATLDLQSDAKTMAKDLADVSGEYVFFCAYLARDDEGEAAKVNSAMLQNFLDALTHTGAIKQVKRIILTCGLKQYGVHQGLPKQPMHEYDDPWLEASDRPPNFYYDQQRILQRMGKDADWDWVVTYPQDVIGYARGNFMNLATALGLYCAVSKMLPGSELPFPGSRANYLAFNCWTSARTHARFCLWAAHAPNAGNNAFNVVNGDTESWQNLWPKLAHRFGCHVPAHMFPGGARGAYADFDATTMPLHKRPPVDEYAQAMGMRGEFEQSYVHQQIDTTKWAQRPEVKDAWDTLKDKYGMDDQTWEKATWGFLTFVLGREFSCVVSMSKARKMGWNGYADTWDEFEHTFQKLERENMLPPVSALKKEQPDPNTK